MAFNFPSSPAPNDTYSFGGKTWVYNGSAWDLQSAALTTSIVAEGANLYYTDTRARNAISVTGSGSYDNTTGVITVTGGVTSVAGAAGVVSNAQLASGITSSGLLTTSNVSELTNLYYTNARARAAISVAGAGSYDSSTGIITVTGEVTTVAGTSGLISNAQLASGITSSGLLTTANVAELNNLYYTNARVYANVTERIANLDGNIIPMVTETYNLGSATNKFKDLYLSGNTIQLGNTTLSSSADGLTVNSIRANVWNGIYTANVLETSDNLYYTNARVYAAVTGNLALKSNVVDLTTANVAELTNLYYTNARTYANVTQIGYATIAQVAIKANVTDLNTTNVTEGSNLYFTNARAISAVSETNISNLTVSGNVSVGGTLNVTGNLNVVGNVTTFNSTVVEIADTIIYLGTGNSGDVQDIGFVGHFTNPGYQHTGFVRDATDGVWKLFANVSSEPSNNTLDFTSAIYSPVKVGALDATSGTFSGAVTGTWNGSSISTTYTDAKIVSVSNTDPVSVTTTAGAVTVGLLNSGVTASTYGNATIVPVITVDAFGRITSASNVSLSASGGSLSNWITKTGNYTAAVGDRILANTSAGAFTITLPSSPITGSEVYIADGNNFSTANVTIARNGNNIDQTAEDLVLDIGGAAVQLVYDGTSNWAVYFYSVLPEPADVTLSTVPPANPRVGDHWVDDTDGTDYTYIFDGDSYQWVNFGSTGMLLTDDTTSISTLYPMMTANVSGVPSVVTVSSTKLYYNPNSGTLSATSLNSVSDAKYKHSIKPVVSAMEVIDKIKPVEFHWVDNGKKSYGVIAQELEQVMPELVDTNEAGDKAVSYIPMIALLLAAVKDQQKEIEMLKSKLNGN